MVSEHGEFGVFRFCTEAYVAAHERSKAIFSTQIEFLLQKNDMWNKCDTHGAEVTFAVKLPQGRERSGLVFLTSKRHNQWIPNGAASV